MYSKTHMLHSRRWENKTNDRMSHNLKLSNFTSKDLKMFKTGIIWYFVPQSFDLLKFLGG